MTGFGSRPDDDREAVRALYVDGEAATEDVADAAAERGDIELASETDCDDAIDRLGSESFDCVIAGDFGASQEDFLAAVDAPLVLYVDDPAGVPDEAVEAADALVERGNGERSRRLLVAKLRDLGRGTAPDAPAALASTDRTSHFLVYEDGSVVWATDEFRDVFPVAAAPVPVPDSADFFERLTALLADDPEAVRALRSEESAVFSVPGVDEPVAYRCAASDLPDALGPVRLVTVEEVPLADAEAERPLDQYRRAVEAAADPLVVLDGDARLRLLNDAAAALLGQPRASLLRTELPALLSDASGADLRQAVARALDEGAPVETELRITAPGGCERRFEAAATPLPGADAVAATLRDVSEYARRVDDLELLTQVLTRVLRHDVRTGLTVIRGQAEVIADRADGEVAEMAETIVRRCGGVVETAEKVRAIEDVLDSDAERTPIDVRAAVDAVSETYPDAEFDVQISESVRVAAHPALPHAVENLIENAVEHGEADEAAPRVAVAAEVDGDWVSLSIADDGPGIDDSVLEVLERREETPLKHGTGVGLWLVDWVIDRSGAEIDFETGDDGTTVTLRLERASSPNGGPGQR